MAFITNAASAGALASSTLPTFQVGTQTITVGAAQPLNGGVSLACGVVEVQNDLASETYILVGNATAQPFVVQRGSSKVIVIDDVAKVYVKLPADAENSTTVSWNTNSK